MTEKKNTKERSQRHDRNQSTALAIPGFNLPGIFEEYMKPFDEFTRSFFPSSMSSLFSEFGGKEPSIDVQDRGDHFLLMIELPGFEKKDVQVRTTSNALELKAEKKTDSDTKSTGKGKQTVHEKSYSYFHRYLTLPEQVRSGAIDGTMKNGVLELKLPKAKPSPKDTSRTVHLK